MCTTPPTPKGQVTTLRAVRRTPGLKPGDCVLITLDGGRALLVPIYRRS